MVSRYLPRGAPPWQLVVLPCAGSESHYLLLRMHHLLLTDGDVNIADILPLATTPDTLDGATAFRYHLDSPLINVLERPEHVHSLYEALIENLTNRWNEFTSNYDRSGFNQINHHYYNNYNLHHKTNIILFTIYTKENPPERNKQVFNFSLAQFLVIAR